MNDLSQTEAIETDELTSIDKASSDRSSAKTACNLARVFSMEEKLKQELELSQDKFSNVIPQLLKEVINAIATIIIVLSLCVHTLSLSAVQCRVHTMHYDLSI